MTYGILIGIEAFRLAVSGLKKIGSKDLGVGGVEIELSCSRQQGSKAEVKIG